MHKGGVPKYLIHDTIEWLASDTDDSEILDRMKASQDTCDKDPNSEAVSGYQALLEILDNDTRAIAEKSSKCSHNSAPVVSNLYQKGAITTPMTMNMTNLKALI